METELKDLIGNKVTKIFMNQQYLRFNTDQGDFTYEVDGDCCSSSFFYDFYGVKNLLENGKIKEIKTVELMSGDVLAKNTSSSDLIQVYGYQITTESTLYNDMTAVFSFRNESNGYYGGNIQKVENKEGLPEILEDVVEVK